MDKGHSRDDRHGLRRRLGHSEGGLVELATAQADDAVCGVILLATPGRPLGELLKEQRRANAPNVPLLPRAKTAIDALAAGRRVDEADLPAALAQLFASAVQGFLISAFASIQCGWLNVPPSRC